MNIVHSIKTDVLKVLKAHYDLELVENEITLNLTKPEFEGDYTVVLFSLLKNIKKAPEQLGTEIGQHLTNLNPDLYVDFNVIKGFLNLTTNNSYWVHFLESHFREPKFGYQPQQGLNVIVEYSSPNTNKPLHLGHLRNNFLGFSIAEILTANGKNVIKSSIVNDRGVHICKSMIAWQLFSNGETPETNGKKGDHLVGEYYVKFNDEYKKQVEELVAGGMSREVAEKENPITKATKQMLLDWELGKPEVISLWKKMNSWVYEGFDITYKKIGSQFDKTYYESNTYLLGKTFVEEGLKKDILFKKEDGSVWIDLTEEGLDEKLVLRSDGTSVYITQDLGLAQQKFDEFQTKESIYVIGDEQNYHMKVLKLILKKLGNSYADGIHHLSYGMVELPTGRMKSREGTVVDADDIVEEMVSIAAKHTEESGKLKDFKETELQELYEIIGLGALKFFLLRVDPKKKMVFNPEESIDFHGFTGPFIQYTHARIKSILRKESPDLNKLHSVHDLLKMEKEMIVLLEQYPSIIKQAAEELNPSLIANYAFLVAKTFNSFYAEHSVMKAESEDKKQLRLQICKFTSNVICSSMHLLGINVPEKM